MVIDNVYYRCLQFQTVPPDKSVPVGIYLVYISFEDYEKKEVTVTCEWILKI